MPKHRQAKNDPMGARAEPVRALLRQMLRGRLKTSADKQRLAEFLGTSESYVKQMIYQGQGGLDAWISALMFCFDLDSEKLEPAIKDCMSSLRRTHSQKKSDQIWFALDEHLSEEEKVYWASLIRVATDIERDFVQESGGPLRWDRRPSPKKRVSRASNRQ